MNSVLLNILIGLAGLSVVVCVNSILYRLSIQHRPAGNRLRAIKEMGQESTQSTSTRTTDKPLLRHRWRHHVAKLGSQLSLGQEGRKNLQLRLQRAGLRMKVDEYRGLKFLSMLITAGVISINTSSAVPTTLGLIAGALLPDIVVRRKTRTRAKKLSSQLPDALGILSSGIRAGFSFPQSVSLVAQQMDGPIAEEMVRLLRENHLGKPMGEALMNLSERTADPDLDLAIRAILIQRQVGGQLADVLEQIVVTIRERVKLKLDARTMTAQGRLSAVVVSFMPLAMGVILSLLKPDYLSVLFTNPIGMLILIVVSVLYVAGIFVLSRIIRVKV